MVLMYKFFVIKRQQIYLLETDKLTIKSYMLLPVEIKMM